MIFLTTQNEYRRKSYVCFEIFIYQFYLNLAGLPSRKSKNIFMAILSLYFVKNIFLNFSKKPIGSNFIDGQNFNVNTVKFFNKKQSIVYSIF
jgi:hypothetical protein